MENAWKQWLLDGVFWGAQPPVLGVLTPVLGVSTPCFQDVDFGGLGVDIFGLPGGNCQNQDFRDLRIIRIGADRGRERCPMSDEGVLAALAAATAGGLAEGGRRAAARVGDGVAGEELVDGQDLDAGVLLVGEVRGGVDAGGQGLLAHGLRGLLEGDEDAELGFLPLHVALEGGDHAAVDVAALDLGDDALGPAAVVVEEVDVAVDPGVRAATAVVGGAGIGRGPGPTTRTGSGPARPGRRQSPSRWAGRRSRRVGGRRRSYREGGGGPG